MGYLEVFASWVHRGHDRTEAHIPFNQMSWLSMLETVKCYANTSKKWQNFFLDMNISNFCIAVQTPTASGSLRLSLDRRLDPVASASVSSVTAQNYIFHLLYKRL